MIGDPDSCAKPRSDWKPPSDRGYADRGTHLPILLIALLLTLLNALKPVTIDDTAFLYYARQIAASPGDPYGFEVFWYDVPTPAMDLLVPAVLPYWLGAGISLFGEDPVFLKLWLLPFALLLVWSLRRLVERFAPAGGTPLLLVLALAPAIVPSFNLMLDLPSLALALGGFALFVEACERNRIGWAVWAGVLAGLALQTKYNTLAQLLALGVYGIVTQRAMRLTIVAVGVAAMLFLGWEGWLALRYGESHILHHLLAAPQTAWSNTGAGWAIGWLALLGALATPAGLLAISVLHASRIALFAGMAASVLPLIVIGALEPGPVPVAIRPIRLFHGDPALDAFFVAGLALIALIGAAGVLGWRRSPPAARRDLAFLLAWMVVEFGVCFWLSPFHAARRLIVPILVTTLALAHLATNAARAPNPLRAIATFSVCLGLLFGAVDLADARAQQSVQEVIERELERLGYDRDRERVWFSGHWGFQYESERRGYQPMVPGRSQLERGDWVLAAQDISVPALPKFPVTRLLGLAAVPGPLLFSTLPSFYQGAVPIRRQAETSLRVRIHRVRESGPLPALPQGGVSRGSLLRTPIPPGA